MNKALLTYLRIKKLLLLDEQNDYEMKLRRDREIALDIGITKAKSANNKRRQLIAWYEENEGAIKESDNKLLAQFTKIIVFAKWVAILLGLLIGLSVATGLFFYSGDAPINVVNFLWVVVFLQLLFVFFLVLSLLPDTIQKFIPGLRSLNNLFSKLSIGKWIYHVSRWMIHQKIMSKSSLDKNATRNESLSLFDNDKKLIKWQMAIWAQWFSLSFNIILLLTAIYLVVFSDLAFGWSSTIDIKTSLLKTITDTLSWPWKLWLPGAVPSEELIDKTRYFRALAGNYSNQENLDIMQLGQWWPFLVSCIVCYGLLPRLILLNICHIGFERRLKRGILDINGVTLLLQRMNSKLIATQSENEPESYKANEDESQATKPMSLLVELDDKVEIVHWYDKVLDDDNYWQLIDKNNQRDRKNIPEMGWNEANDTALFEGFKNDKISNVLVLIKSWEPPMMSFIDWISNFNQLNTKIHMQLLPYGITAINDDMLISQPNPQDLTIWQNRLLEHNLTNIELMRIKDHE